MGGRRTLSAVCINTHSTIPNNTAMDNLRPTQPHPHTERQMKKKADDEQVNEEEVEALRMMFEDRLVVDEARKNQETLRALANEIDIVRNHDKYTDQQIYVHILMSLAMERLRKKGYRFRERK